MGIRYTTTIRNGDTTILGRARRLVVALVLVVVLPEARVSRGTTRREAR
jgi:hypothetical protein